ncbi:hypothetical protein BGZ60DRAFT_528410 [Tricladium varicosporioides]|nr:hypothetical protein BGZ60DRAFT_528410 [Hymenoscyphus varicosporioides]
MGILCSSIDKEGDEQFESKPPAHFSSKVPRRLQKMHQTEASGTISWQTSSEPRNFENENAYEAARTRLIAAERSRAFDAKILSRASEIENEAAALVRKIKAYDYDNTYGPSCDHEGNPTGKRTQGEHFLGNVDLINSTELMKVARRMPKGAHLHIHFNSCLPASFLIRQARDIDAMYIRSTLPLTSLKNMAVTRISFMVLTRHEATHVKDAEGNEKEVKLGNVWSKHYVCNTWMSYKQFQNSFKYDDGNGRVLVGTEGAEEWLVQKMLISEEEAHETSQTGRGIWEKFNYRTQMMKGLFAYESAFRNYTRECIRDFVKDNIQYAEIRPNFMATNSLKTDDGTETIGNEGIMNIINEEMKATMEELQQKSKYFAGMKVIYCTPRSFQRQQIAAALDECIDLKKKFPALLCGFDLVGHEEMGNELKHFIPEFLDFQKACVKDGLEIPFLFHCGETLDVGDKVDGNLFDAVLLNAKRIGHGYAIARHPLLMDIFKARGIAIESCPISNEILGLTPVIAGHHLPIFLANNVPCTVNSDNATFYKSSLSHDFYQVMIGSESMSLLGWKQLCEWSLEHSCMDPNQKASVTKEWAQKWHEFCEWIVDTYGPKLQDWEPAPGRH